MSTFIGKYEVKMDVKGRVFIPAVYRKLLSASGCERMIVRKESEMDCLVFYTEDVWNAKVEEFKSSLNEWDPRDQMLLMQYTSAAEVMDVDTQGRVLISKKNLDNINAEDSDMLFVGMVNKFALWSKARFEEAMMPDADFSALLREKMAKK